MIVKFPNQKTLFVACSKKCGTTSITSILGYPRLGRHAARQMKHELVPRKEWFKTLNRSPYTLEDMDYTIAVVRDPVRRLASCFLDRVLLKNRNNIKAEVDNWEDFINNLEYFRDKPEYTDLRRHSFPQVMILGTDTSRYDKIFKTSDIGNSLVNYIGKIANYNIIPIQTKVSSPVKQELNITEEHKKIIRDYYSDDYTYWSNYF